MFNVAASHFLPFSPVYTAPFYDFSLSVYFCMLTLPRRTQLPVGVMVQLEIQMDVSTACRTTDGAVIRIFIIKHHFKSNAAVVRRQRIWVCCLNIVLCSLLFGVQRVVPCEVWSRIPKFSANSKTAAPWETPLRWSGNAVKKLLHDLLSKVITPPHTSVCACLLTFWIILCFCH